MWVLVETVSMFRHRYVVEVPDQTKVGWALDSVTMENAKEFSQEHVAENIISHRVIKEKKALALCRKDNSYLDSFSDDKLKEIFFTSIKD